MARCKCGAVWAWEWCHDIFMDADGEEHRKVTLEDHSEPSRVSSLDVYICKCGAVKCAIVEGMCFFDCEEFRKVDWEKDPDSVKLSPEESTEIYSSVEEEEKS